MREGGIPARGAPEARGCVGAVSPSSDRPSALSPESRTIESLALLKAITSSPTVGFGFVDRDCRIVRLNAMLAAITGGTVEEQIGRTVAEAVPHLWPQLEAAVRHVLESGEDVVNHEVAGEGAGGEADRHWLASFHAVEGGAGEVVGVAAIVFDVTKRQQAGAVLGAADRDVKRDRPRAGPHGDRPRLQPRRRGDHRVHARGARGARLGCGVTA